MRLATSKSGRGGGLKIMVRGLLVWSFCLATVAYLGLATAWYATLNQRPSNLVTWSDCVMAPVRWKEIRAKRGDAYIAEGLKAMEDKKWNEAILKIEAGLNVSPNNRQGRRQLGLFFVIVGQRERGLAILEEGFEHFYPGREDLELFLRLCVEGEDFSRAIRAIDQSLRHAGLAAERDEQWLRDQMVRVLMLGERYEAVLVWLEKQDMPTEMMMESRVVSYIELGDLAAAHDALVKWKERDGSSSAVLRIQVRLAREENSLEEMRAALNAMREQDPMQAYTWVYAVIQEFLAGDKDAASNALDSFLLRFGGKRETLVLLAEPLVQIKAWSLFDKIENRFLELGLKAAEFDRLRCEAAIARGNFVEARRLLEMFKLNAGNSLSTNDQRWFDTTSAMAAFLATREDSYGAELIGRIQNTPFSLVMLRELTTTLLDWDREELARDLLGLAQQRFPSSLYVKQTYQILEKKLGAREVQVVEIPLVQDGTTIDLESEIQSLAKENEPSIAVQSAKQFLAHSDRMIESKQWSELSELLRELRRARPAWSSGLREEITMREVALNKAEKNWPALVTNVRFLLDGTIPRALTVISIIRDVDALGARSTADSLLSDLERRHKDFPPAKRLRDDWAAQAAAEKEAAVKAKEVAEQPETQPST